MLTHDINFLLIIHTIFEVTVVPIADFRNEMACNVNDPTLKSDSIFLNM